MEVPLVEVTCTCGMGYAIPQQLHKTLRREGKEGEVYCPAGHTWCYVDGEDAKLQRKLDCQASEIVQLNTEVRSYIRKVKRLTGKTLKRKKRKKK